MAFWLGTLLGFVASVILWFITTKVLIARVSVSESLTRLVAPDGRRTYRFSLKNAGHRDAVDVRVKSTLFSTGWAQGPSDEIAIIDIPVSVGQIDVMPGRRFGPLPARTRPVDTVGDRFVTLRLTDITEFQKSKMRPEDRARLASGEFGVEELLDLGKESFINIVVYGFDRFSGSRSVYAERYYKRNDIS